MDCLVTKLKGVVSDDSLLKLGEFVIDFDQVDIPDANTQSIIIRYNDSGVYRAIKGNFTDSSLSANEGKEKSISGQQDTTVYLSNGGKLAIETKKLMTLNLGMNSDNKNKRFSLESLKYSSLSDIKIQRASVYGDISNLQGLLVAYMDISNNDKIYGDISAFSNYARLTILKFSNTGCTGNLSSLYNLENLFDLTICKNITGDAALLANSVYFLSGNNATLSWSSRNTEGNIIAMENINLNNDVDKMLINQAICQIGVRGSSSWYKVISVTGTRTSASDSAISTLKGKGFTVTVPTATDANSISTMSLDSGNYGIAYKDKELIVEPVDLTKMQIYPANDVIVKKFNTLENAEKFIKDNGLVKVESK